MPDYLTLVQKETNIDPRVDFDLTFTCSIPALQVVNPWVESEITRS